MLPQALLDVSAHVEGGRIVPHYLGVEDEPWLRALLAEFARYVGQKRTDLHARLKEPRSIRAPKSKLRIAIHVLDALCRDRTASKLPPKEARAAVFREAAGSRATRAEVLSSVAVALGATADELEASLFADLRCEQRVAELPKTASPAQISSAANLAILTSLVRRAAQVRIAVGGNARALVFHARRGGLICNNSPRKSRGGLILELSGPFALFRHSDVYGRALASLVPRLAGCADFELSAACALGRSAPLSTLVVRSGDPIDGGRELARHERRVEERFMRAFRRAARDWDVLREPAPLSVGDSLIFPDFELVHRRDQSRRWLLELVGFWTAQYLNEKLERLRAAGIERLILCVDQKRLCSEQDLPAGARIIRYKTRIDPQAVLAIVGR
ncbi:MAG: DUF790 family protein [Polyangiaceae bacterium]